MEGVIPYLTFEGRAQEALAFYCEALGGQVLYKQTFRESELASQMPEAWQDKVMHAAFEAGGLQLMMSDTADSETKVQTGDQVALALNLSSEEEVNAVFVKLSAGGSVSMALETTEWGAKFGMLTDKFGIKWMLNFEGDTTSEF